MMLSQRFEDFILLILLLIVLTIVFIIIFYIEKREKELRQLVINTSQHYHDMVLLNSLYQFHDIQKSYCFNQKLTSKSQFDKFNFDSFLDHIISENRMAYELLERNVTDNQDMYTRYLAVLQTSIAPLKSDSDISSLNVSPKAYHKYEERLTKELILFPEQNPTFICNISYTSPKGRNSYSNSRTYTFSEFKNHLNQVHQLTKYKSSAAYQRSLMSDSLRYDILKRDGFRCVLCGRTAADGVKLHVDHIIPVSKGGKTVPENLRTLCDSCNLGKRDKYDKNGLN